MMGQTWRLTSLLGLKLQLPCRPLLDWMEVKLRRGTGLTRVMSASLKVQGRPRYSPQLPGSVVLQAGDAVHDVETLVGDHGRQHAVDRLPACKQTRVASRPHRAASRSSTTCPMLGNVALLQLTIKEKVLPKLAPLMGRLVG